MLQVSGERVEALPFVNLKKIADLLEFEGPLLSHFKDDSGSDIFFYWVDYDSAHNRWLVFQVSDQQFSEYISKKVSLHQIITQPETDFFYTVDIDDKIGFENILKIHKDDLEEKYLPGKDSFYS